MPYLLLLFLVFTVPPPAQKTAWLAIFYMCIPTGIALGYVYGGLDSIHNWSNCSNSHVCSVHISWKPGIWFIGIFLHSVESVDRCNEDSKHTSQLLEENTAESTSKSSQL